MPIHVHILLQVAFIIIIIFLTKRIDEVYQVNLLLDNLPAIQYTSKEDYYVLRWMGYPVGLIFRMYTIYITI